MEEEEEEDAVVAGRSSTMSPGSGSGNAPSSSGEGEALPLSMATQGSSVRPQGGGGGSREEVGQSGGPQRPTPPPPVVPPTKQQYLCQPLLDAVLANIRSPVFNHSLYRTFMPAMTAIHGPSIVAPVPPPRKRKFEEDDRQTIPNVLQGEVARLNPKFLVNLDPAHCSNNGTVHLICKIDDKNLPNVPPLQLSVPADYPEQSPLWVDNRQQYEANPFLQSVHRAMMSKLLQLPDKHSVTALLQTWAQSIRQASLSAA